MMQPVRRESLARLAVAVVAVLLPVGIGVVAQDAPPVAHVIVEYAQPAAGRVIELPGSFESYESASLFSRITGYASAVHVDIGDRVTRNQPLVELSLPEMKSEIGRAEAELAAAEAALTRTQAEAELAGVTYERLAQLQSSEPLAVTSQNVDVARAERSVAQARVASASAEIDLARAMVSELKTMMDYAFIRAPFAGVVTRRDVDRGELVVSGDDGGVSVLEVTRMDRLRLVLAVPEQIVPMTRVGMMVRVRVDALPQSSFKASVSRLTGALRMDTRTMRVEIDMGDEDGRLRPGMYALVQLELDVEPDALSIPASLVQRESGGIFVWTVHDGVARKTPIEVVRDDGDRAVIRAELDSGATLVVGAPADLAEGQQVRIVQSEASQ